MLKETIVYDECGENIKVTKYKRLQKLIWNNIKCEMHEMGVMCR